MSNIFLQSETQFGKPSLTTKNQQSYRNKLFTQTPNMDQAKYYQTSNLPLTSCNSQQSLFKNLSKVDVKYKQISDIILDQLLAELISGKIEELDLFSAQISSSQMNILSQKLFKHKYLKSIDIGQIDMTEQSLLNFLNIFIDPLICPEAVQEILLSKQRYFSVKVIDKIADIVQNRNLQQLELIDLHGNHIGNNGFSRFIEQFIKGYSNAFAPRRVIRINFQHNQIGSGALNQFINYLSQTLKLSQIWLHINLDLRFNQLNEMMINKIKDMSQQVTSKIQRLQKQDIQQLNSNLDFQQTVPDFNSLHYARSQNNVIPKALGCGILPEQLLDYESKSELPNFVVLNQLAQLERNGSKIAQEDLIASEKQQERKLPVFSLDDYLRNKQNENFQNQQLQQQKLQTIIDRQKDQAQLQLIQEKEGIQQQLESIKAEKLQMEADLLALQCQVRNNQNLEHFDQAQNHAEYQVPYQVQLYQNQLQQLPLEQEQVTRFDNISPQQYYGQQQFQEEVILLETSHIPTEQLNDHRIVVAPFQQATSLDDTVSNFIAASGVRAQNIVNMCDQAANQQFEEETLQLQLNNTERLVQNDFIGTAQQVTFQDYDDINDLQVSLDNVNCLTAKKLNNNNKTKQSQINTAIQCVDSKVKETHEQEVQANPMQFIQTCQHVEIQTDACIYKLQNEKLNETIEISLQTDDIQQNLQLIQSQVIDLQPLLDLFPEIGSLAADLNIFQQIRLLKVQISRIIKNYNQNDIQTRVPSKNEQETSQYVERIEQLDQEIGSIKQKFDEQHEILIILQSAAAEIAKKLISQGYEIEMVDETSQNGYIQLLVDMYQQIIGFDSKSSQKQSQLQQSQQMD